MLKAILFDADGVVITPPQMFSVTLKKEYGVEPEQASQFFLGSFEKCLIGEADLKHELKPFLKKWNLDQDVEKFIEFWFKSENHPNDILLALISKLRRMGIRCYLVTNQEKYRTEFIKEDMGFQKLFDDIFSSAEVGYQKPDLSFFNSVLSSIGLEVDQVVYTDDTLTNIQSAMSIGIRSHHYQNFHNFLKFLNKNVTATKLFVSL